jgi:hypothetical protein
MSTKIYTAWRVPSARLNEFLDTVRPQMFESALAVVKRLMERVKPEAVQRHLAEKRKQAEGWGWKINEEDYQAGGCWDASYRNDVAFKFIEQARDRKTGYNLIDCGFNVWLDGETVYLIPWGPPDFYSELKLPEWAEDYSYWNNTDRPDDIPEEAWSERGNNWDRVAGYSTWDDHRMNYQVVNLDRISGGGFGEIHFEMARRWQVEQHA